MIKLRKSKHIALIQKLMICFSGILTERFTTFSMHSQPLNQANDDIHGLTDLNYPPCVRFVSLITGNKNCVWGLEMMLVVSRKQNNFLVKYNKE